MEESLKKTRIQKEQIDQVFMGSAIHAENEDFISPVMARQSLLKAGLPPQTKSVTVDKVCCPSMVVMQLAFNTIR
jgi:acetyl-CoA C-acetyltransferase